MTDKPFAITLDVGTSRANHTGSWRTERPEYVHRAAPCGHACPAGEDLLLDQGLGLLDEARRQLASALDRRQVPHVEVHEPHLTLLQRSGEHVRSDHGILDGVIDPNPADRAHDVCGVPDEQ